MPESLTQQDIKNIARELEKLESEVIQLHGKADRAMRLRDKLWERQADIARKLSEYVAAITNAESEASVLWDKLVAMNVALTKAGKL